MVLAFGAHARTHSSTAPRDTSPAGSPTHGWRSVRSHIRHLAASLRSVPEIVAIAGFPWQSLCLLGSKPCSNNRVLVWPLSTAGDDGHVHERSGGARPVRAARHPRHSGSLLPKFTYADAAAATAVAAATAAAAAAEPGCYCYREMPAVPTGAPLSRVPTRTSFPFRLGTPSPFTSTHYHYGPPPLLPTGRVIVHLGQLDAVWLRQIGLEGLEGWLPSRGGSQGAAPPKVEVLRRAVMDSDAIHLIPSHVLVANAPEDKDGVPEEPVYSQAGQGTREYRLMVTGLIVPGSDDDQSKPPSSAPHQLVVPAEDLPSVGTVKVRLVPHGTPANSTLTPPLRTTASLCGAGLRAVVQGASGAKRGSLTRRPTGQNLLPTRPLAGSFGSNVRHSTQAIRSRLRWSARRREGRREAARQQRIALCGRSWWRRCSGTAD